MTNDVQQGDQVSKLTCNVATKQRTTRDIRRSSSLCNLGCHGEYPHPTFVPTHLAETQDGDGMTMWADEGDRTTTMQ